jgi:hypothetical protein
VGAGIATYSYVQAEDAVTTYNAATTTKETAAARDDARYWGGLATRGIVMATGGLTLGGGGFLLTRDQRELVIRKSQLEQELKRLKEEFVFRISLPPAVQRSLQIFRL